MKYVAEFNPVPEYIVVEGMLGKQSLYRIMRLQVNGNAVKLKNYYYNKECQSVVSTASGPFAKGKVMKLDKYRKVSLQDKIKDTAYSRTIKVSLDEIQYSAAMQL